MRGPLDMLVVTASLVAGPLAAQAPGQESAGPARAVQEGAEILVLRGPVSIGTDEVVETSVYVVEGDVVVSGRIEGDLVALHGDVRLRRGARVEGDVIAVHGRVEGGRSGVDGRVIALEEGEPSPGRLERTWHAVVSVGGVFLALGLIGFGIVTLSPNHLETGAQTVSASLGRAFITGLLGQALALPTLVMIVVGLTVTVVGLVAVPFAVLGYLLLAAAAVVGGFLAVARVVGEKFAQRRRAAGALVRADAVTYLLMGLGLFAAMWLGAALFASVPVAGIVLPLAAGLVTWLAVTVGLGAALLSRLGTQVGFAGSLTPGLTTDEFLWPTPIGSPAQRKP